MKFKFTTLAASIAAFLTMSAASVFAAANVKDYGATGNGSTDDTGAINAAIFADSAIYFPPGHYRYVGSMVMTGALGTRSYRFYGDGPGNSVIEYENSSYGIYMPNEAPRTLTVEGLTLRAKTAGCGTAIRADYGDVSAEGAWKTRCLTVRNVQIQGTDRTGYPAGYWNTGIYLGQGTNSVIEDVQMEGHFQNGTALYWGSAPTYGATQLMVHNVSMLYWAQAVKAEGHVEGLYMSSFELVGIGTYNAGYAIDIDAYGVSHSPVFNFTNGHISFLSGGIHCHNVTSVKVANVNFAHVGFGVAENQSSGTHLYLDDVWTASVANCDFAGPGPAIPYENGVFAGTGSNDVQVTGCLFSMYPNTGGSALVALSGVARTRWLDNGFNWAINRYDNYAGSQTFIRDIP